MGGGPDLAAFACLPAGRDGAMGHHAKHARYSATGVRVHPTGTDSDAGPPASACGGGPEGPSRLRFAGLSGANLPQKEPDARNPHVRICEG